MRALKSFLTVLGIVAAAGGARAEGLTVTAYGAWTLEVVFYQGRSACSVLIGDETGPSVILSKTDDSPFFVPVFELTAEDRTIQAGDVLTIRAGTVAVDAAADIFADDDGVHIAAYPDPNGAERVVEAMRAAPEATLTRGGAVLMRAPLEGFPDAWAGLLKVCG